jgi:predicted enzyme related to lactoylglutathione lyase
MPTRDEAWPTGTPCWIDVMVTDPGAARAFYSALFGWDIQDGPPEAGGYLMCMMNGRPVAAISPKPESNPFPNVWSTYLASDDVDATIARAAAAGSQIMMEPMDVMTAGRMGFAMDPTGAPYGIWQAGDHLGVGVYNEPGTLVWNELMTRDYEGAKAFYGTIFGYTYDEIGEGFSYSTVKRAGDREVVAGMGELDNGLPAEVSASWVTYFLVEDVDASAAKAGELGATIVREPFDTPFGRMAPVIGAQGEAFSLIQAPPRQDAEHDNTENGQ